MKFLTKENLTIIGLALLLLIVSTFAIYLLIFSRRGEPTDFFRLNQQTQEFQKVRNRTADPNILDVDPDQPGDVFLGKVLKGYFHDYDPNTNSLQLKNEFLGSSYLQLLEVNISVLSHFYCWPETVTGGNGSIDTKTMEFYVYPNGQDLIMPGEKYFTIDLLASYLEQDRYLIIQLRDIFRLNTDNQVQKLILLGC